jgi:putative ATP-dependent endonuclease of OLD family
VLLKSNVSLYIAKQWTLEWCLYKSTSLSELFKKSVSEVHNKTKSFQKSGDEWNENFERTLISKLKKGKGNGRLDKVAVANVLAEAISINNAEIDLNDEYIQYIIRAIKHACGNQE